MSLASSSLGLLASTAGYVRAASLFGEEETIGAYLTFEATLARVEGDLGIIPASAVEPIVAVCRHDCLDLDRLRLDSALVGYPIVPLVSMLAEAAGEPGQWVHFGATTQDVMDTAQAIQLQRGLAPVIADIRTLEGLLADLCRNHRTTMMAGRSKLQHAVPIPFGYKVAAWLDQIHRRRVALEAAAKAAATVQFGGAVGTLAALSGRGMEVRASLARELGLGEPEISWHTSRDRTAEVSFAGAAALTALSRMVMDIIHMMSTEVGELREPANGKRGSSSTMPQKRNPVLCEAIVEAAREVRHIPARLLDAMMQEHERGTGHGYGERNALVQMVTLLSGAATLACEIVSGLEVDKDRMARNLELTGGLIHAEAIMIYLARKVGRVNAHGGLHAVCRSVAENGVSLPDAVRQEYGLELPEEATRAVQQIGSASAMIDAVLARISSEIPPR